MTPYRKRRNALDAALAGYVADLAQPKPRRKRQHRVVIPTTLVTKLLQEIGSKQ